MSTATLKTPKRPQGAHYVHAEDVDLPGIPDEFSHRPAPEDLKRLGKPLCEMGPGLWACGTPEWEMPTHITCKLLPGREPGSWMLEPERFPGWIRMGEDIGERLGILGLAPSTLRRLMQAGYIEHIRYSPWSIYLSIDSIKDHMRATMNDCARETSFWTKDRMRAWRETIGIASNLED